MAQSQSMCAYRPTTHGSRASDGGAVQHNALLVLSIIHKSEQNVSKPSVMLTFKSHFFLRLFKREADLNSQNQKLFDQSRV